MASEPRPYRSMLYVPGSNLRALQKARGLPADALVLDLEDAVTPAAKLRARDSVAQAVCDGGYGPRATLIRINGLDTEWGADDLALAGAVAPDGVLVPKVEHPAQILDIVQRLAQSGASERMAIWAMIETPRGVLNASAIAGAHPQVAGLVLGTNDLVKDLGAAHTPERAPLIASLGLCLLAARAEGLICIDGVHNALEDEVGLRAACAQGRDMGFDGKALIHPAQVAIANAVFAPSHADLDVARREVAAFEQAQARGEGVAVVDGRLVENLHATAARRLLSRADAIARMAAAAS